MEKKTRVFPSRRLTTTITAPLSILDATVARFTPTGAIWLFDRTANDIDELALLDRLHSSFVSTLNDYPYWAGQLQWAPVRPGGSHTERFNRPIIVYGAESDPGVEWRVVRHPSLPVKSLAPLASERAAGSGTGFWRGDAFDQSLLLPDSPLPLHDLKEFEGLPAMQVQVNLFNDSGYGVGVKMAHALADAQSLMLFIHQWAANCRKLFHINDHVSPLTMDRPVFDPARLDACATGDVDGPVADPELVEEARQLPLHRFDWWLTQEPGYPPFLVPTTENSRPPPSAGLGQTKLSPSEPAPWQTWDFSRPVRYVLLHFTGAELRALKERACLDSGPDFSISKLDALLAHIWAAINRARGHSDSAEDVFLNLTIGARTRVHPPLPDSFVGSPLFLTHLRMSGASACASSVGQTASHIRHTIRLFTSEKMNAMLHDAAHEVSPQRLWQAFLGTRHTLVTSWLRLQVYQVDFVGSGQKPRYVHAAMPKMDGCLQVMDSGMDDGGIDLALYLDAEAMQKLLLDQALHII